MSLNFTPKSSVRRRDNWWDRQHRLTVERAFRQVPYYREQWAKAGRASTEPIPVAAADLHQELFRLCPLPRPWEPSREASLWLGDPRVLAEALRVTKALPAAGPVLEVRRAMVDWTRLGPFDNNYAPLLAPNADVSTASTRTDLQRRGLGLARAYGQAIVVASPTELSPVLREARALVGDVRVDWSVVQRLTAREAAVASGLTGHSTSFVVHDPYLGYFAARDPECAEVHVLWRRVHCHGTSQGLVFTRLREYRPTLVDIIPVEPGFVSVRTCVWHGTPVLSN
jgi:hypothetical protein